MSVAAPSIPEPLTLFSLAEKAFPGRVWIHLFEQWQNLFFALFFGISVSLLFRFAAKNSSLIPSPLQNFCEWLIELLQDLVTEVLGPEGRRFLPFLGTLFVYILSMNLSGLIPLMKPATSSINTTIALSLCVFCLVQYLQFKHWGIRGYAYHLAGSPHSLTGWLLAPLIFFLDLLAQFTRPLTLAFRLFGNIFGEEVLIGYFILTGTLIFYAFQWWGGVPLQLPFLLFSAFVSLLQALVFTLLSTIYLSLAFSHDESHEPIE